MKKKHIKAGLFDILMGFLRKTIGIQIIVEAGMSAMPLNSKY